MAGRKKRKKMPSLAVQTSGVTHAKYIQTHTYSSHNFTLTLGYSVTRSSTKISTFVFTSARIQSEQATSCNAQKVPLQHAANTTMLSRKVMTNE